MTAAVVNGTLVAELGEGLVRVQADQADISELEPGASVELKLGGDPRRYLGIVLALREGGDITVLVDEVSMTDQVALVEDLDEVLGGLPGNVPPIQGMER